MKEYYYLNQQREPQGPHSFSQLAELMANGRINPTTLVACKGGENWEPLGSLLSREDPEKKDIPPLPRAVGQCPSCKRELSNDLSGNKLPSRCPGCGTDLYPAKRGIWGNFRHAIRNAANFKGRATRAEYWSFILVSAIIFILLHISVAIAALVGTFITSVVTGTFLPDANIPLSEQNITPAGDSFGIVPLSILIIGVVVIIGWLLYMIVPAYSVLTRRLHDAGWSGWWIILQLFINFLMPIIALLVPICIVSAGGSESSSIGVYDIILNCNSLISFGLGILIFVLTLVDSQRGANKYGPSSKYPLG